MQERLQNNKTEYSIEYKNKLKQRLELIVESNYSKRKLPPGLWLKISYLALVFALIFNLNLFLGKPNPQSISTEVDSTLEELDSILYELDGLNFDNQELSEI